MLWLVISRTPQWTRGSEPKVSLTKVQKRPNGAPGATGFFGKYQWGIGTLGGSEVNCQLLSRSLRLQYKVCMVVDYFDPEYGDSGV